MEKVKSIVICLVTTINAYVVGQFGVFTPLLWLTILLMISDLGTRVYAAGARKDEKVESKKVWQGFYRKIGMGMLIILSLVLDSGLNLLADTIGITIATKIIFTALTLAWIFVREFISNLENLQMAGIELPDFITKALNITKEKVDQLGDTLVTGKDEENESK